MDVLDVSSCKLMVPLFKSSESSPSPSTLGRGNFSESGGPFCPSGLAEPPSWRLSKAAQHGAWPSPALLPA